MPALNHKGTAAIVKEGTWGTDPGSGYEYIAFQSEAIKNEQDFIFVHTVRGSRNGPSRKVLAGKRAGGTLTFEANVEEGIGLLLYSTLGAQVTVDNGSGNGGLHTFTPSSSIPVGLSMLIDRDVTPSSTNIWSYVGGRVRKLSLEAAEGQLLKVSADLSFKAGTASATAGTPAYSTENPLVYHQGVLTVDGTPVAVKSFKLDIDTGLIDKRGQLGSAYQQQQQPGVFKVTGEIEAYFDNMTLVNKFIAGADSALVLTFTGSAVGTSTRALTITLPYAQFMGESPNISGPEGEIMLKLPFTAYQPAPGTELITAALLNSKRTDY